MESDRTTNATDHALELMTIQTGAPRPARLVVQLGVFGSRRTLLPKIRLQLDVVVVRTQEVIHGEALGNVGWWLSTPSTADTQLRYATPTLPLRIF